MINILLIVLALILGTILLGWRMRISSREQELENTKQGLKKLEAKLQEERKRFEQGEIIRKTIEETALKKEGEYEQLKSEFQEKDKLLKQEEIVRKEKEADLLRKEKEQEQLKRSYESLKEVLVKKGLVKKTLSPNGKESLWISGQSAEKRGSSRLILTRDYNRTVILRIDSPDKSESIKSFVNNISSEGLCFESRKEFTENEPINLRLFFYGVRIPIIKIQGQMAWKKKIGLGNYYGVFFEWLDEKDKLKLDHYIDSKTGKHSVIEKTGDNLK